jgi:mannose-1-phosphate guanylyltransferase
MKAFLLAAGKGSRLKPYTDRHPKCLIPIHGTPLLKIWIDLFERFGITDILINTHHHADQVEAFVRNARNQTPLGLHTVHEAELKGSAGTLWENRWFVEDQDDFVIAYADNLTNLNLDNMIDFHRNIGSMGGVLTMGLIHAPNPSACGIVSLDCDDRIITFVEKPTNPQSDLANCGVYIAAAAIYDYFAEQTADRGTVFDIAHHLLPRLTGKMFGYPIEPAYLKDIGTPQSYREALAQWPPQGVTTIDGR